LATKHPEVSAGRLELAKESLLADEELDLPVG